MGEFEGEGVGDSVGPEVVGSMVGCAVGAKVVGDVVGDVVGRDTVGVAVGLLVGFDTVGLAVGDADGAPVGAAVGTGRKQHDRLQRLATSGSAHALEPRWELKWWIVNWQAS